MSAKINIAALASVIGTMYPPPFHEPCRTRARKRLGDAAGLTQFGVNLLTLPPGAWSSQRHWHTLEDEFVFVLSGEVTLGDGCGGGGAQAGGLRRVQGGRTQWPQPAKPFGHASNSA